MMLQTPDSLAAAASAAAVDIESAISDAVSKVTGWLEGLVESLPNVIAAGLLMLVFWGIARVVRKVATRVAQRVADQPEINRLVGTVAYLGVLGLGLVLALGILQLDKTVTSLLAGAGIIGLALGFAFQDIAENFIAGIILNLRNQFTEGDIVRSGDFMGVIERVQLRATVMRTFPGQSVLIPNAQVFKNPIINYTAPGSRRIDIGVGVSYGDDLEEARRVAIEAVDGIEARDRSRDIDLFYEAFGDSSINFSIRFWIPFRDREGAYLAARSEAIIRIKKAFDEAGITIPFPIRTLDFAGGDSGGQSLSTAIREAGYRGTAAGGAS
jgi:small conductance mechanosensitive channel